MVTPSLPPKKKLPIAKLAMVAGVLIVVAAIVVYFVGWRTALDEGKRMFAAALQFVADAGPAAFFGAMAILPAFGAPMAAFAIAAGLVFRERIGFPATLLLSCAALTFNLTATYWLARRWLRPLLTRWLVRLGYRLPQVGPDAMTDLIVLLRVTPGPPFFVQNYLLGLANAPFLRYLVISCAIQCPIMIGFMLFGEALNQGRGKLILLSVLGLATLIVGTHVLRKHWAKKKIVAT